MNIPDWLQYYSSGEGSTEFFGVTQSPGTHPERKSNRLLGIEHGRSRCDRATPQENRAHETLKVRGMKIARHTTQCSSKIPRATGSRSATARKIRGIRRFSKLMRSDGVASSLQTYGSGMIDRLCLTGFTAARAAAFQFAAPSPEFYVPRNYLVRRQPWATLLPSCGRQGLQNGAAWRRLSRSPERPAERVVQKLGG